MHTLRLSAALLSVALLPACANRLTLDEETVDVHLDRVTEDWPMCRAVEAGAAPLVDFGARAAGSCGGEVTATFEHENGDTDYAVAFDAFCLETEEGPMTIDGDLRVFEDGTPSDVGPVIDRRTMDSVGPLHSEGPFGSLDAEITGFEWAYGYPDVDPGVPDDANPDVITLQSLEVTVDGGRVDVIRNVELTATGDTVRTIRMLDGEIGSIDDGVVDMMTPEDDPLVIDVASLSITSGSLEFHGANNTVLVARPDPARPGVYTLTLDGEPVARDVDCSGALNPLISAMIAMAFEVPLF
jgi:hypothetical protein